MDGDGDIKQLGVGISKINLIIDNCVMSFMDDP